MTMNLAVDIGNSYIKAAVYHAGELCGNFRFNKKEGILKKFEKIFDNYPYIKHAILSSTADDVDDIKLFLEERCTYFIRLDENTPIPIVNEYATPETLGCDRIAAAVGGYYIYPRHNVVIVDFGSAITIDLLTKDGAFTGGNISPGLSMRFKALNTFTDKLPLCEAVEETEFLGNSTRTAVESGVINSVVFEIEGYLKRFEKYYGEIKILFTGGDGNYFAKRLKNPIFANCDLVVYGLNQILEYNVQKRN
ncbi:MAG: type III pantothenate kinase [Rikenellaceae bacterium]|nr:type III pantothenate kinase [Rikenellaceae bacterium]